MSKPLKITHSTDSALSGKINVWEQDGGLVLEVGGYPQSVSLATASLPQRYWSKAANIVSDRLKNPKRALIVGIGGATIPHLLSQKIPQLKIVGVELDPEIIKVAREFFDLDRIKNMQVVEGDGHAYIFNYRSDPFDLIFIDAYLGGNFPLHFEETDFLLKLRQITSSDGLVVINRASGFDRTPFEKLINKVFDNVEVVRIPLPGFLGGLGGNYLYLCR